ncbi:MAG: HAMP domain-containing protein [Candidatus Omnitrophota bacterium]|nr:HAMP domain-containing protein [Candidatus Omnitrophota bacterium]
MDNKFANRRRNYYIDKKFQTNFIIKFCSLVALGAAISGYIIYSMSRATVTTTFINSRLTIKSTADYLLPAVFLSSAVVIVLIGLATIAVTLLTSHKIAGPLYRLEKDIDEITAGNLNIRFNLRKGDEIKALASSLERMSANLRDRIVRIRKVSIELESEINSCCKEAPEGLRSKLEEMKKEIAKFNV